MENVQPRNGDLMAHREPGGLAGGGRVEPNGRLTKAAIFGGTIWGDCRRHHAIGLEDSCASSCFYAFL